jgi:hypothetical protein
MRTLFITLFAFLLYSCQKEIDPTTLNNNNTADSTSAFVLTSSNNSCSHIVPAGTYKKNLPLISANKISVDVTVTKLGNWKAGTNTVSGISFSGSGQFTSIGNQTVILQGAGIPTQAGATTFTINSGSSSCSFVLNIDTSSSVPPTGNISPIANAGSDISITLPTNSVTLKGSGTDADGTISSYLWTKIAGPSNPSIATPNQAQATVSNLLQGTYQFELKVTDNGGATGKDTVSVTVLAAAAAGTLAMQQSLFAVITPPNAIFGYDGSGKIVKIASNYYPERRITYLNGKISTIEYWYDYGGGTLFKEQTNAFVYDANGNVIKINQTDHVHDKTFLFAEFTYNADKTMSRKKLYFDSGSPLLDYAFIYKNGNLTGIVEDAASPTVGDTTIIGYDTRTNNFKSIYPQFYFLDIQTDLDQTYQSEIFYFSKNYPISLGGYSVSVSLTAGQKPSEIRFDNELWYRYVYN